mgnify:CR=1 FL=1
MTKRESLNMAVKVMNVVCDEVSVLNIYERRRHYQVKVMNVVCDEVKGVWDELERIVDKTLCQKYGHGDTHSWSDSAGESILFRCGDYYAVGYWTGEDMVFIYEVNKDQDLCESLTALDPIFSEQVYPLRPPTP